MCHYVYITYGNVGVPTCLCQCAIVFLYGNMGVSSSSGMEVSVVVYCGRPSMKERKNKVIGIQIDVFTFFAS